MKSTILNSLTGGNASKTVPNATNIYRPETNQTNFLFPLQNYFLINEQNSCQLKQLINLMQLIDEGCNSIASYLGVRSVEFSGTYLLIDLYRAVLYDLFKSLKSWPTILFTEAHEAE